MHPRADALVVGGGVIGCACAYELARRGAKVVLFERDELAAGASGRNHGLLLSPLDPLLVPMAQASSAAYDEMAAAAPLPIRLDARPIGFLLVAGDDETERTAGRLEAEAASRCGVEVEPVNQRALRDLEPELSPDLAEGWLLEDARRVDPAALTVALALLARQEGALVRTHTAVRALHAEGSRVGGVVTDEGLAEGDMVVVAAGPWSAALLRPLGLHVPVLGARGWLVHLAPRRPPFTRVVGRAGWHSPPDPEGLPPTRAGDITEEDPITVSGTLLQPNADGTILVGGSRQATVASEPEDSTVPRKLLRDAIRLVPRLAEAEVLSAWWGIRPMTPDGLPIVGPAAEGLYVATGHGSLGVTLAGGTAQLVSSMILDQHTHIDPGPFAPRRFRPPEPGSA
jgi:glycine/D-amino acid oxidase-like deaminating enzyme